MHLTLRNPKQESRIKDPETNNPVSRSLYYNSEVYYIMKKLLLILLVISIFSCRKGNDTTVPLSQLEKDSVSLVEFERALSQLPNDIPSSLKGLEIFKNDFEKSSPENNDRAFKSYLAFQAKLMDSLNQQLIRNPDLEKIESTIWDDSTRHHPEGKAFMNKLFQNGLRLASTEGMVYIERETQTLRNYFYDNLSPSTQKFFGQFELETNQPMSADGGFIIPIKDVADRLGFWDAFLTSYPEHLFSDQAANNVKYDLYFFLIGLDNTPAFSYDDGKLNKEFLEAYKYFIQKYPDSKNAGVIKEYLQLLEKAVYKQTEKIKEFSSKYNPYG